MAIAFDVRFEYFFQLPSCVFRRLDQLRLIVIDGVLALQRTLIMFLETRNGIVRVPFSKSGTQQHLPAKF